MEAWLTEAIDAELKHARAAFPDTHNLTVALMEEVGELAQAQLQGAPWERVKEEAVQVITVAARIVCEGDKSLPTHLPGPGTAPPE